MTFSKESISSASSTKETLSSASLTKETLSSSSLTKEALSGVSSAKEALYTSGISTQGFKLAFFATIGSALPDSGAEYVLYFYENLDSLASMLSGVTAGTTDEVKGSKYIEASIKQGKFVFTGYNAGVYEIVPNYIVNEGGPVVNSDTLYWLNDSSLGFYNMNTDDFKIYVNQISGSTPSAIWTGGLPPVDEDDIMYLNVDNHFLQDIDFKREN
jgi:hypothetical protein